MLFANSPNVLDSKSQLLRISSICSLDFKIILDMITKSANLQRSLASKYVLKLCQSSLDRRNDASTGDFRFAVMYQVQHQLKSTRKYLHRNEQTGCSHPIS